MCNKLKCGFSLSSENVLFLTMQLQLQFPDMNFWENLDRELRRRTKMIKWMINGQFIHGINCKDYPSLTPERIEEPWKIRLTVSELIQNSQKR